LFLFTRYKIGDETNIDEKVQDITQNINVNINQSKLFGPNIKIVTKTKNNVKLVNKLLASVSLIEMLIISSSFFVFT
jgi:hypothetical protein